MKSLKVFTTPAFLKRIAGLLLLMTVFLVIPAKEQSVESNNPSLVCTDAGLPGDLSGAMNCSECSRDKLLCSDLVTSIENSLAQLSTRSYPSHSKFARKKVCLSSSFMNSNFLGESPQDFRVYFGLKDGSPGIVLSKVNASNCADKSSDKPWWVPASTNNCSCSSSSRGGPTQITANEAKSYCANFRTFPSTQRWAFVESWTYDASIFKSLLAASVPPVCTYQIDFGLFANSTKTQLELDPIFTPIANVAPGATVSSKFLDWADPCPPYCKGDRLYGNTQCATGG